jgi:hypothetical protein
LAFTAPNQAPKPVELASVEILTVAASIIRARTVTIDTTYRRMQLCRGGTVSLAAPRSAKEKCIKNTSNLAE